MSNLLEYLKQLVSKSLVRMDQLSLDGSSDLDNYQLPPEDVAAIESKDPARIASLLDKLGALERSELCGLLGISHNSSTEEVAACLTARLSGVGQVVVENTPDGQISNLMEQIRKEQGDLGD